MERVSYRLKTQHFYNSHNFTSSSKKVYIQSVQVLTLQTPLYMQLSSTFHAKAISLLETIGLPGGMSTLEASVKPRRLKES